MMHDTKETPASDLVLSDEHFYQVSIGQMERYLFTSQYGDVSFCLIEEEMAQLNDFCATSIRSVKKVLEEQGKQYNRLSAGQETAVDPEIGDVTDDVLHGLEEVVIPHWAEIHEFMSRASNLLLLHVLVEKSLKDLCRDLVLGSPAVKQQPGLSMIDSCIVFLKQTCALQFTEPAEAIELRNLTRKIRNSFAHGDWNKVRSATKGMELRDAFRAATALFNAIEAATHNRP